MDTHLDAKTAAIDVISQKEVVRLCKLATDLKGLHQVVLGPISAFTHGYVAR